VAENNAVVSLQGRQPPELDGVAWLNTDDQPLKLAELRGKYVLLDFWFTGCGPCHHDFPSVKLVHALYNDKGLVVIGIHDNSNTPDEVREHVAKIGLPFPIVVDHADGRMVASFRAHGIANGFPNYVLIGPDGTILLDDRTIPHPPLHGYKVEIVRQYLLSGATAAPASGPQ
jgi:thiol-disulfide isomerase/thioredoxin